MKVGFLNTMHMEFRDRFAVEFEFLVKQSTFAELVFANNEKLFDNEHESYGASLRNLFECSFEGLALSLSRLWDEKLTDLNMISIPNLAETFAEHDCLGCRGLLNGGQDWVVYQALYHSPLRGRLRTARSEVLAHSLRLGRSKDRNKSDVKGVNGFNLVNGDLLAFCDETAALLYSLCRQLSISGKFHAATLEKMRAKESDAHIRLLRLLLPDLTLEPPRDD